jgi:hypothetical protein
LASARMPSVPNSRPTPFPSSEQDNGRVRPMGDPAGVEA